MDEVRGSMTHHRAWVLLWELPRPGLALVTVALDRYVCIPYFASVLWAVLGAVCCLFLGPRTMAAGFLQV